MALFLNVLEQIRLIRRLDSRWCRCWTLFLMGTYNFRHHVTYIFSDECKPTYTMQYETFTNVNFFARKISRTFQTLITTLPPAINRIRGLGNQWLKTCSKHDHDEKIDQKWIEMLLWFVIFMLNLVLWGCDCMFQTSQTQQMKSMLFSNRFSATDPVVINSI